MQLVGDTDSNWASEAASRRSQGTGHVVDADGCPMASFFAKTELRGDEQRHGRARREVLDGGGGTALQIGAGAC